MKLHSLLLVTAVVMLRIGNWSVAQDATPKIAMPMETGAELMSKLTAEQRQQFESAGKLFDAQRYGEALTEFKALLHDLPGEPIVSKFASEAALQIGDAKFALVTLAPIIKAHPSDWQAIPLVTRAYAETGDKVHRDEGMAQMMALRQQGATPQNLQQYTVERIKAGDKDMTILTYLVPWGNYKIYDMARVADAKGAIYLRISLESGDADQPGFAKEHPAEAAAGKRLFSIDAYRETGLNSAGQRTQAHYTFAFYTGQPSYEVMRDKFLEIMNSQAKPISSRTGLIVP